MFRPLVLAALAVLLACNDPPPQAAAPAAPSATPVAVASAPAVDSAPAVASAPPATSSPPPIVTATGAASATTWRTLIVVRPPGWTVKNDPAEKDHVGVVSSARTGKCNVRVDAWAGRPPSPGGPMVTQSTRKVTVDGHKLELTHTSEFQGAAAEVDAIFANDGTSYARAVFRDCTTAEVDQALATAKLAKAVQDQ